MSNTSAEEDIAKILQNIGLAAVYTDWAGAIVPFSKDYSPDCDCISCTVFTEFRRLLDEYKKMQSNPDDWPIDTQNTIMT